VCGASRPELWLKGGRHALSGDAFGSSRTRVTVGDVLRCVDCGFGFSAFRPTEDQLAALYREMDPAVYEAEAPGRLKTAQRHLAILNRHHSGPPGRLLEIGCASGAFLNLACDAGWDSTGVEPSAELCGRARRVLEGRARIVGSSLQGAGLEAGAFDAVAMFDVLEHVPGPVGFLKLAASLMKPGGLLVANLPDLDSPQARLLGRRWPLLLPEHLNYFNRPSLERAATGAGLRRLAWGRRPAAFSAGYVLHRLSQHGIPGVRLFQRWCGPLIDGWVVPVYMGELWSVWRRVAP
jgi:SAM-dependent methyltransferase